MNLQGSNITSPDWITNLTARVNAINLCSELQVVVAEITAELSGVEAAINAELAAIAPIIELLTNPAAALADIANWIAKFIEHVLTPMVRPQTTMVAQLIKLGVEIGQLVAAIEAAAARIENCVVTLPTVPAVPSVPAMPPTSS